MRLSIIYDILGSPITLPGDTGEPRLFDLQNNLRPSIPLVAAIVGFSIAAHATFEFEGGATAGIESLAQGFRTPPDSVRPWVYWVWTDGNLSREGITADIEAMKKAGIGGVMIMEVNVGVPQGPVKFMSPEWRGLFKHVVDEAERCGIEVTLMSGPGWTGSGGPWVRPEQSMQHIVGIPTQSSPGRCDSRACCHARNDARHFSVRGTYPRSWRKRRMNSTVTSRYWHSRHLRKKTAYRISTRRRSISGLPTLHSGG